MKDRFHKFAQKVSDICGSPYTFGLALLTIIFWIFSGPFFGYSDTWQLIINTGTTIFTFLMVFLIQNTQNRDARALHLKLDELIRANDHARNQLIELEDLSDDELDKVHNELCEIHKRTEKRIADVQEHRASRNEK